MWCQRPSEAFGRRRCVMKKELLQYQILWNHVEFGTVKRVRMALQHSSSVHHVSTCFTSGERLPESSPEPSVSGGHNQMDFRTCRAKANLKALDRKNMEIALWCWVSWYMDIVSVPLYFMGRSNGKLRSTSAELHTGFMPWTIRQISDDLSFWNSDCWIYDFFRTQVDVSQLGFIKAQTGRLFLTHYGWSWTNSETVIPKQVTLQASRIEVASLCNLHPIHSAWHTFGPDSFHPTTHAKWVFSETDCVLFCPTKKTPGVFRPCNRL